MRLRCLWSQVWLLFLSVYLDIGPGFAPKDLGLKLGAKSATGLPFFDIFHVVQRVMSSNVSSLGLAIIAMGGFAKYMDKLNAGYPPLTCVQL